MQNEHILHTLEQADEVVAFMTGIKQKFIDSGWSEEVAEKLAYDLFNQAIKKT